MLTSFLSLYIAAQLDSDSSFEKFKTTHTKNSAVTTASQNLLAILEDSDGPIKDPKKISPIIESGGAIAIDRKTGKILFEKNPHSRMPMASITKLMTALITIEENQLDEIVTITTNAAATAGSNMALRAGEKITVENLIKGLMINSANDAAVALAEHNSGTSAKFTEKMNKRAEELALSNTHFSNPTGLDDPGNYSSPYDLAKLGNYIYNNKLIQEAANTKSTETTSTDGQIKHPLESTNELIGNYPGIKGLKTGKTDAAGLCLIAIAENQSKNEIISVVLNSPARFQETKVLTDWVFRSYKW